MRIIKIIKRVSLATVSSFFLLTLSPHVLANMSNIQSESDVVGVNCSSSSVICSGTLSVNKKVFSVQKYACPVNPSTGFCDLYSDKTEYSDTSLSILRGSLDQLMALTAGNDNSYSKKLISYGSCTENTNGTHTCITNWKINSGSAPGGIAYTTENISSSLKRDATGCNPGTIYFPGQGCSTYETRQPEWAYNSSGQSCKAGQGDANPTKGNPVDITTGAKVFTETDISYPIDWTRNYSSKARDLKVLGGGWRHPYEKTLGVYYSDVSLTTDVATGLTFKMENNAEIYFSRANSTSAFTPIIDAHKDYILNYTIVSPALTRYTLKTPNNQVETYEVNTSGTGNAILGVLTKIQYENGFSYTLAYNSLKQLTTITDSYGHSLTLTYSDYANVITKVQASNGDYIDYTYLDGYITSAKFNNTETLSYAYTNGNIVSRTDAKGNVFAEYVYDTQNRATDSKLVLSPGVYVNRYQFAYGYNSVTMTMPDNSTGVYNLTSTNYKPSVYTSNIASNKNSTGLNYDLNGNVSSLYNGINYETYNYNSTTNLMSSSTVKDITQNYTWDTTNRRISSYTENSGTFSRTYNLTYDASGNMTQRQITAGGQVRAWNYTYGTYGKMLTASDPTGATTTIAYYSDTHANIHYRGKPSTITNAMGHITTINSYNNQGQPTSITYPNNITKTMTYDFRGRLLTETQLAATNTYTYNANGNMTQAALGNGYTLNVVYDNAHRMTEINDNRGNKIVYTLDANGNPTNESEYSGTTLVSVKNKVFDSLSRPTQESRAANAYPYEYTYDKLNRVTDIKDPNNATQTIQYDNKDGITSIQGLNRNQSTTRDGNGNPDYLNQSGNVTSYTYNAFNDLQVMSNNDIGYNSYSHTIASRTKTHTDGGGTTHTLVYDYLGRPTSISHGTQTEAYTWDSVKSGKITSITDYSGSTTYGYDTNSRLNSKTHLIGSMSKSVGYAYDTAGQLNKITYPSGMEINYTYSNGVISQIQMGTTTVLGSATYQGFGNTPIGWTWGNSTTRAMGINTSERLVSLTDGSVMNKTITQDNVGNITGTTDTANTNNSFTATYSASSQLLTFGHTAGNQTLTQDTRFNLASLTPLNSTTSSLGITHYYNNNKISSLNYAGVNKTPTYNSKGMLTADGKGGVFTYDLANNLATANTGTPATYTYNALHQRVSKTVTVGGVPTTTYFAYNEAGLLLGEYNSSGTAIAEHIYFGSLPVGVVKGGTLYYVHTDHLGTPRAVTNNTGTVMWKWENTNPYGNNLANETVSGTAFEYNLRFPGQYFDKETNLHYNYHRHYNPETGRYMQPDPIGADGGMNLYAYVENNPLGMSDPEGLSPQDMERFKQISLNTINRMIEQKQRLPGKDNGESNNRAAYSCNTTYKNDADWVTRLNYNIHSTLIPPLPNLFSASPYCSGKEQLLVCHGQAAITLKALRDDYRNNRHLYDDSWSIVEQSGGAHYWIAARSSKGENFWVDAWHGDFYFNPPEEKYKFTKGPNHAHK